MDTNKTEIIIQICYSYVDRVGYHFMAHSLEWQQNSDVCLDNIGRYPIHLFIYTYECGPKHIYR